MWEIYSEGRTPFENRSNMEVVNEITRGVRLYRPQRASQPLFSIMYRCWHEVLAEHAGATCRARTPSFIVFRQ